MSRLPEEMRRKMKVKAAQMYREGMSIREIAASIGRSYGCVHNLIEQSPGVEFRSRGGDHNSSAYEVRTRSIRRQQMRGRVEQGVEHDQQSH